MGVGAPQELGQRVQVEFQGNLLVEKGNGLIVDVEVV